MKVYIACHHPDPANELAAALAAAGHEVVSTWHLSMVRDADVADPRAVADENLGQIEKADALVLVASPEHLVRTRCVPGGKFVEAGYAMALTDADGRTRVGVFTLGGIENLMLRATGVWHARDVAELLSLMKKAA